MESEEPKTLTCTILTMDPSCFSYKVCSNCETVIPETPSQTPCNSTKCNGRRYPYPYKRFFRLMFSIATDTEVQDVVAFDKAARVIFGCSAQEFFDFATLHPYAAKNASNVLEGEIFEVTLSPPKRIKADHLRMTNVVPLRTDFKPVIKALEELYPVLYGDKPA